MKDSFSLMMQTVNVSSQNVAFSLKAM